jgi:Ni,Fe-hydrogenase I cytochrome b subunit
MTTMQAIRDKHEHISPKQKKVYLHPLPVRLWHWLNALGFLLLIITGFQLRYVDIFSLMSFEAAVKLHNWIGFGVIANWFLWFIYYSTATSSRSSTTAQVYSRVKKDRTTCILTTSSMRCRS